MRERVLAVDPGNVESGWSWVDASTARPIRGDVSPNEVVLEKVAKAAQHDAIIAIEMVASYGMAVGAEVFETVLWTGRFLQMARCVRPEARVQLVYRRDVKLHHCGLTAAKDSNVRAALIDRFAPGQRNFGKGTKQQPGWFYGFRADMWQSYALAVLACDRWSGTVYVPAPVAV